MPIPPFDDRGLLPPGIHLATLEELAASHLVHDTGTGPEWDVAWRAELVGNLRILSRQLWTAGVERVFVNGSFVEAKGHPEDIDGYFEAPLPELEALQARLNELAGESLWGWEAENKLLAPAQRHPKIAMWHKYRVELWPVDLEVYPLLSESLKALLTARSFAFTREGLRKGILELRKPG